jgi:6-phosphofructokinase 1
MTKITRHDFDVASLGPSEFPSPLQRLRYEADAEFITDDDHRVLFDSSLEKVRDAIENGSEPATIEHAGPRERIFHNPSQTICAVVTCGGLCPGLNDVIRGLVLTLNYSYGVRTIYGIPFGYEGFVPKYGHTPIHLTPESVTKLHCEGGSILGSSRGPQTSKDIVDFLVEYRINVLFVIGGDGTLRGAQDVVKEVAARGLKISVIGIPKTIDNDLEFIDKSFGFETAFAEAVQTVRCAHIEAQGYPNGVGLVKLMGRDSGFIAAFAALAENSVNYVLIPEVPFQLQGKHGLLSCLEDRLARRGHAVVVVAEGAGQHLMQSGTGGKDASGNLKYGDIGPFLKKEIETHFRSAGKEINIKYIDPSYVIRSVPASPQDAIYCLRLAQNAVHAAMAGKTNMVVGRWHGHFVNLPMDVVTVRRRKVNPTGDLWMTVLEATGQPAEFK